jgi:hypothetical protein
MRRTLELMRRMAEDDAAHGEADASHAG